MDISKINRKGEFDRASFFFVYFVRIYPDLASILANYEVERV
ncbi:hypothetical protein [Ammoniphilus resinae]|nr:hypothetical protein [Ammoniphilus resinae]